MNARKFVKARKSVVVLLLSLMFQNLVKAQDFDWISQFGTPDSDIAGGVAADSTGVYVAGSTIVSSGQSMSAASTFIFESTASPDRRSGPANSEPLPMTTQ